MTDGGVQDRRRFPRISPAQTVSLHVPAVYDIEVVDISQSGLLFCCTRTLRIGQRAQIRAVLDRAPFAATIEVVRLDGSRGMSGSPRVGARFVAVDEGSRRTLEQFLTHGR